MLDEGIQLTFSFEEEKVLNIAKTKAKETIETDDISALYRKNRSKFLKAQARRKEIAKNEFKLFTKERELLCYLDIYVFGNFLKNDIALKNHLADKIYSIIDNTCLANNNSGNVRIKYQKNILADISAADFFLKECLEKYIIKRRKFNTIIKYLGEVRAMTNA